MHPNLIVCLILVSFPGLVFSGLALSPDYWVEWEYDEGSKIITFQVDVATKGFVGFGLSPTGAMRDADIVVGGVTDDGTPYFSDYHGTGNQVPVLDESQDWFLISASENDTHTSLRFWRILNTCDDQDWQITADTQKMIWSFGATDTLSYHSDKRGTRQSHLLDPLLPPPDLSMYKTWEVHNRITIPAKDTTYWCTIHKTPNFTTPHHVIGYNIHLPNDLALRFTHHADLFKCRGAGPNPEEIFEQWVGDPGVDCWEPDPSGREFPGQNYCDLIEYGWAIGGDITMFPSHVGFPLEPNTYYMLEVHYDNPRSQIGVNFETGHTLYYTDELREYEAGYFLVGSVVSFTHMIPPNSVGFTHVAHCTPWCTDSFHEEGLNVFAFLFHGHTASRALKMRVFRNSTELEWPLVDSFYDFNYQQQRVLKEEFKLYPGDHVSVECVYDTTWKNGETTIGGRSTRMEMCITNLYYYKNMRDPQVVNCNSELRKEMLLDFLGIESVEFQNRWQEDPLVTAPPRYAGLYFTEVVDRLNWTAELRAQYQNLHRYSEHEIECLPRSSEVRSTGTYPNVPEWEPVDSCSSK